MEITPYPLTNDNVIKFSLHFATPQEVTVYEEYLIYDKVAVISAIGGTLGLCIGFSFMDIFGFILKHVKDFIIRMKEKRRTADTKSMFIKTPYFRSQESNDLKEMRKSIARLERQMQLQLEMTELRRDPNHKYRSMSV